MLSMPKIWCYNMSTKPMTIQEIRAEKERKNKLTPEQRYIEYCNSMLFAFKHLLEKE